MIYSNLLKSTALIAGLSASANALTHYKSGEVDLVKRASELGNTGITYDISEDGLTTTATFNVDYDDVVIAKGYVVSEDFTLSASDSGFSMSATYANASQFCEDADKWMLVYSYDGSTPALIAPDCDNYFTLLEKDGSVIDWKAGGCVSLGSFTSNKICAELSSSSSAAPTTTSAAPTTFTEIVITETVSGVSTEYTTYCPLTSGTPDYSALSTSVVTVSEGVTTTVVIPCSECAEKASSAASANANPTGGLFVETTYVTGTTTVTSLVPCPSTSAPTTFTEIVITKTVEGTSTVYTTYCPLSSGKPNYSALSTSVETVSEGVTTTVVIPCSECAAAASSAVEAKGTATGAATTGGLFVETTIVAGTSTVTSYVPCPSETGATATGVTATAPAAGEGETVYTTYTTTAANGKSSVVTSAVATGAPAEGESVSSTVYTTYSTTAANGAPTTVTSAVATTAVPAVAAEGTEGSSSTAPTGSAAPSVLEGGASIKYASSGLIAAAVAMFLL